MCIKEILVVLHHPVGNQQEAVPHHTLSELLCCACRGELPILEPLQPPGRKRKIIQDPVVLEQLVCYADGSTVPEHELYISNKKMMVFKCKECSSEPPHVTIHSLAAVVRFEKTLHCRFCNGMSKSSYEEAAWDGMIRAGSCYPLPRNDNDQYAAEVRVVQGWNGAVDLFDWGASLILQIDGEQHLKPHVRARDERFNALAAGQGHSVLRILCVDVGRMEHWLQEAHKMYRDHPGRVFVMHSVAYGQPTQDMGQRQGTARADAPGRLAACLLSP